jgi:hypothetical protein
MVCVGERACVRTRAVTRELSESCVRVCVTSCIRVCTRAVCVCACTWVSRLHVGMCVLACQKKLCTLPTIAPSHVHLSHPNSHASPYHGQQHPDHNLRPHQTTNHRNTKHTAPSPTLLKVPAHWQADLSAHVVESRRYLGKELVQK